MDKSRVVSEAPYSYPQRRHRTLFEREMLYANLDNHPHDNSLAQLRVFQERESLATDLREICDDSTRGRAYMSPTIYRDSGYTLMHLIEEIRHGKIALPDIQRPFVLRLRDLLDPEASSPRSVERHHLFPKATHSHAGCRTRCPSPPRQMMRLMRPRCHTVRLRWPREMLFL